MDVRHHQLVSLIAVADAGGFSPAAAQLFITPSALIQQINNLERNLGFSLFERSSKGCVPTKEGALFIDGVRRLLAEFDGLAETCRAMASQNKLVRFGVFSEWQHSYVYASFFSLFQAAHPEAEVSFVRATRSGVLADCLAGKFDVCMYPGDPADVEAAGLVYHQLREDTVSVIVSADSLLANRSMLRPSDLAGQRLYIDCNHITSELAETMNGSCDAAGIDIELVAYTAAFMFAECARGACFLMPSRKVALFSPLKGIPLEPSEAFVTGLVTRQKTWPLLDELVDAFVATQ